MTDVRYQRVCPKGKERLGAAIRDANWSHETLGYGDLKAL